MNKEIVLVNVDTKISFMDQATGRLYVPGAENIRHNIYLLNRAVQERNIRRIFLGDRHFADNPELARNGGLFPDHCMDKQYGQINPDGTYDIDEIPEALVTKPLVLEHQIAEGNNFRTYTKEDLNRFVRSHRDLLIEKQTYDFLSNPSAKPLLEEMKARGLRAAIVDGVVTEICVLAGVLGLQSLGIQTYVVEDAIHAFDQQKGEAALKEMKQAGARFIKAEDVINAFNLLKYRPSEGEILSEALDSKHLQRVFMRGNQEEILTAVKTFKEVFEGRDK